MYTSYFGLKEKPFAIAPNPKYLFMSDAHKEALAHLLFGVNGEGCISLLTGDVGTGKTTVCRCLLDQSPPNTDIAMVLNPKLSIIDLLSTICEEFGIKVVETHPTVKTFTDAINSYLLKAHAKGRNSALIIDEAQNLEIEILEHLRLLTNLETNTKKLLQIVLIGQPELRQILDQPELLQVSQRVTTRFHLGPLLIHDIDKYVRHRIEVAGGPANYRLFDPKSVQLLAKVSKGVPRIINLLCDRALLGAYAENRERVTFDILKKAVQELRSGVVRQPRIRWGRLLAIAISIFLFLVPVAMYLTNQFQNKQWFNTIFHPSSINTEIKMDNEQNHLPQPWKINIRPLTNEPSAPKPEMSEGTEEANMEE